MSYTIRSVTISNIKGIAQMKFEPGMMNVVHGQNGSGKSSLLTAISLVFDGGYDPTWIRGNEKKGQVEMVLDPTGHRIVTTLVRKGEKGESSTVVYSADGEKVPEPRTFVKQLAKGFAYNPVAFMSAEDKARGKFIQDFATVDLTQDEIFRAVKEDWWHPHYDPKASAFTNIAAVRKAAFDRRTAVNRTYRDLDGMIRQLQTAMPSLTADSAQLEKAESDARLHLENLRTQLATELNQIKDEWFAEKDRTEANREHYLALQHSEFQRRMEELKAWNEAEWAKIYADCAATIATVDNAGNAAMAQVKEALNPQIEAAAVAHATAKKDLADYNQAVGARKQVSELEDKAREVAGEEIRLSSTLERLDALRNEKLSQIPIEGLELRDGSVYVDGLPFDALNTAKQIQVSLAIAANRPGALPFMLIDNAEHLDPENWELFKQMAVDSGFQVVAAKVSAEPELAQERVA